MKKLLPIILLLFAFTLPCFLTGQITSLTDAQGLLAGTYTFNFGNGDFQAYVDEDGWLLWMQYHHAGGTNPGLRVIQPGDDLPVFDGSPLGADFSTDVSKWGHGAQAFAASIPDGDLWLRWEAETSHHNRKIHFESPVLGRFQSDAEPSFTPEITYKNIHRPDHTANLPDKATTGTPSNGGNNVFLSGPFWRFNTYSWEVNSGGRWNVDDVRNADGTLILGEHSTIHRVWVKPVPFDPDVLVAALDDLQNHINGLQTLTAGELNQIKNTISIYAERLPESESLMVKAQNVVADYDDKIGPLFTTPNTQNGFNKDPQVAPGLELERVMVALQQGLFDFVFTPEVYAAYPDLIDGFKFNMCVSFPGDVAPPADPALEHTALIRANFADPEGINPSYNINNDGTDHAFRPTGLYVAPGSVVTVTVPASLVGKDYYIRVGAHEWDLNNKPVFKRLDRITKKFAIDSTTVKVFNPLGGAIGILVPYGAAEGIVEVSVSNAVEAPFFSLKSFYETPDFEAELAKPAPWAVFETDNVLYTIPKHSIVPGEYDLWQTLKDWDTALQAINAILSRQIIPDKHDLYMIADVLIRGGAYSIGYPMSNTPINYSNVPGTTYFIDGPGPRYETNFHELGHSIRISKFPGEVEAIVNFLYVMALHYGLNEDLNEAVRYSFVPNTFDIDKTAAHRLVSDSFGSERNISNTTMDEVRYQHRGYGHYFEIVDLFGWCPHKNFWKQELIDFENGTDHGINDQNIDSRIVRMCIAADADLRPLLHVFGILPQDPVAVQEALELNNIPSSLAVYNRLQAYMDLIPADNEEFLEYALSVYPNLNTAGPTSNPDYGVGWHYQKSLSYDEAEAQERTSTLQGIIDLYFPNGQPLDPDNANLCCLLDSLTIDLVNDEISVTGGTPPYDITVDTAGTVQTVTVVDAYGCGSSAEFSFTQLSEQFTEEIVVFPNPAATELLLQVAGGPSRIAAVQMVSITGQVTTAYPKAASVLDVSRLQNGLYILQIILDDGALINKRVMILR